MLREDYLKQLMSVVYDKKTLNLFDFSAEIFSPENEEYLNCIEWAKDLVQEKLAVYSDQEKTMLQLTNYGRYWILKGGYEVYLRDSNNKKDFRKIKDLEKEKLIKEKEDKENYVIGGEESYGMMIGSKIRDKDAISAVAILCEMAAYEKDKGKSLFQKMVELYVQFGFYKEHLISITKKGMDGQEQIAAMMESYRSHPPKTINGAPVAQLLDYELRKGKNLITGEEWEIKLPKSNVLQFLLADGTKISARPSGTEPKIKFYFSVNTRLFNAADFDKVSAELDTRIKNIISDMKL